jgi:CheY-like chemotaxis protein
MLKITLFHMVVVSLAEDACYILIVDDLPEICEVLAEFFTAEGYLTKTALCCADAVRHIRASKPSLILLDINMSGKAERSIKPFVIGRKNFLFSNTPRGARASAVIYSIVETAKENGLIPFEYLTYLFERLPNLGDDDIDDLLPWSDKLPSICKLRK